MGDRNLILALTSVEQNDCLNSHDRYSRSDGLIEQVGCSSPLQLNMIAVTQSPWTRCYNPPRLRGAFNTECHAARHLLHPVDVAIP